MALSDDKIDREIDRIAREHLTQDRQQKDWITEITEEAIERNNNFINRDVRKNMYKTLDSFEWVFIIVAVAFFYMGLPLVAIGVLIFLVVVHLSSLNSQILAHYYQRERLVIFEVEIVSRLRKIEQKIDLLNTKLKQEG